MLFRLCFLLFENEGKARASRSCYASKQGARPCCDAAPLERGAPLRMSPFGYSFWMSGEAYFLRRRRHRNSPAGIMLASPTSIVGSGTTSPPVNSNTVTMIISSPE